MRVELKLKFPRFEAMKSEQDKSTEPSSKHARGGKHL